MGYNNETFMSRRLRSDMYACGREGLPPVFAHDGLTYRRRMTFKHDFFACTGKYVCEETNEQVVLKLNRIQPFMGIPLKWIGRFLTNRELDILRRLEGIDQVPEVVATFGPCGMIYRFVPGKSLDENPPLPHNFFFMLQRLSARIHHRRVCHMDLNKRGNVLVGADGRPHIIDFQIALYLPGLLLKPLRNALRKSDSYHILKHKRRFRADLLKPAEWALVKKKSTLIRLHRKLTVPLRKARRYILGYLFANNLLTVEKGTRITSENDPRRYQLKYSRK